MDLTTHETYGEFEDAFVSEFDPEHEYYESNGYPSVLPGVAVMECYPEPVFGTEFIAEKPHPGLPDAHATKVPADEQLRRIFKIRDHPESWLDYPSLEAWLEDIDLTEEMAERIRHAADSDKTLVAVASGLELPKQVWNNILNPAERPNLTAFPPVSTHRVELCHVSEEERAERPKRGRVEPVRELRHRVYEELREDDGVFPLTAIGRETIGDDTE